MSVFVCLELNWSVAQKPRAYFDSVGTGVLFSSVLFDASRHDIWMLAWTINNVYLCWQRWFLIRNSTFFLVPVVPVSPPVRSFARTLAAAQRNLFGFSCAVKHTLHTYGFEKKIYLIYLVGKARYVYVNGDGGRIASVEVVASSERELRQCSALAFPTINIVNFIRTAKFCWQKSLTNKEKDSTGIYREWNWKFIYERAWSRNWGMEWAILLGEWGNIFTEIEWKSYEKCVKISYLFTPVDVQVESRWKRIYEKQLKIWKQIFLRRN